MEEEVKEDLSHTGMMILREWQDWIGLQLQERSELEEQEGDPYGQFSQWGPWHYSLNELFNKFYKNESKLN